MFMALFVGVIRICHKDVQCAIKKIIKGKRKSKSIALISD